MDKSDNYLLLVIGVLLVALIAVELIPLPEMGTAPIPVKPVQTFKAMKLSSSSMATLMVIPTSTLATLNVIS